MEASAIQILVQTEKHVVRQNALTRKPTKPTVVVATYLVLKARLARTDRVRDVRLRVPMVKHAAKAERHAARFAVMMDVVRIPIIVAKVMYAPHANVPLDKPAVVLHAAIREKCVAVLEVAQHVAPEINTAMELDTAHHATQYATRTKHAAVRLDV